MEGGSGFRAGIIPESAGGLQIFILPCVQTVVVSFFLHQLLVGSGFHDLSIGDGEDLVTVHDGGQTVGNDEAGSGFRDGVAPIYQAAFQIRQP